jgi:hypothetical protein
VEAATTVIEAYWKLYVEEGNNKVLLLSMSFGLINDKHMMGDITPEPFWPLEKSKKPKKPDLQREVDRRGQAKKMKDPSCHVPKSIEWDVPKMLEWLKQNPIQDKDDIEFLQKEEQIFYNDCCRAMEYKRKNQDEKQASMNWTNNTPWMRLCRAAMEDDAKEAFLVGAWKLTREELDARGNELCPRLFEEVVANHYNNPNKVYITIASPELHDDFTAVMSISFDDVPGGITPDQVKS